MKVTGCPSMVLPVRSMMAIIPTVDATIAGEFGRIMAWADKYRRLQVRTNADTPSRCCRRLESLAQKVSVFAVQSICSLKATESHAFREMICSETVEEERSSSGEDLT